MIFFICTFLLIANILIMMVCEFFTSKVETKKFLNVMSVILETIISGMIFYCTSEEILIFGFNILDNFLNLGSQSKDFLEIFMPVTTIIFTLILVYVIFKLVETVCIFTLGLITGIFKLDDRRK